MAKTAVRSRKMLLRRKVVVQELWWLSFLALGIAVVIALGVDALLAVALGLAAYALWHLVQAAQLLGFVLSGRGRRSPRVWGLWQAVYDQVARLRRRERRRKRRQKFVFSRIRKMAAAMPDAVLTLGSGGEISWFNRQAGVYFGLGGKGVLGRRLADVVEHPILREYLEAGQYRQGLEVEAPGDPTMTLAISVTRFRKRREHFLLVARDITRQYYLNRTQRDFTLNVSHELKTPLTVLRGYLEILAEGGEKQSPKHPPWLRMQEQVSRMQGVIEDLFTLSRLEYGTETLKRDPVAVLELLADVVRETATLAQDSQHELRVDGDPGLLLMGDGSLLHCAFSNLVSNAIRHTPGHTRVQLSWTGNDDQAELVVRDNGKGIPARHLPRLTERFYRVDASRSRDAGGTGLGLAIVRQILDMHGARLSISSDEGRGSTFTCIFPSQTISRAPDVDQAGTAS